MRVIPAAEVSLIHQQFTEGKMSVAETVKKYSEGIEALRDESGPSAPGLVQLYTNLGQVHKTQEEWHKAEDAFKQALYLEEELKGKDDPSLATYHNALGGMYRNQGNNEEAETEYLQALHCHQRQTDKGNDPKVDTDSAVYLNNLALVYKTQERLALAEKIYVHLIKQGMKLLGETHAQMALRYSNLGSLAARRGRKEEAHRLFTRAHEICIQNYGRDHPETTSVMQWLQAITDGSFEALTTALPTDHEEAPNILKWYLDSSSFQPIKIERPGKKKGPIDHNNSTLDVRELAQSEMLAHASGDVLLPKGSDYISPYLQSPDNLFTPFESMPTELFLPYKNFTAYGVSKLNNAQLM